MGGCFCQKTGMVVMFLIYILQLNKLSSANESNILDAKEQKADRKDSATLKIPAEHAEQKVSKDHAHHLPHKHHVAEEGSWVLSFGWNLVGYLCIIIPSICFIRVVKTSNFYEKDGQGRMLKLVQCCVFGLGDTQAAGVSSVRWPHLFSCLTGPSPSAVGFRLMFCTLGLQLSYLIWGVLQEKVMTQTYGEGQDAVKFRNSEFLVFTNRVVALLAAGLYILLTGPKFNGPFYKFSYSSLSNICSSWCQYEALRFVSFPTQVLGKASKMIPVMIMGKFISKQSYQYYEYVIAVMISIGVSMFLLSSSSDHHASAETTVSGLVLMVGYIVFDSFTSNWQSELFTEYKVSSMQMMFNVNFFSSLFTLVSLLVGGGMVYAVQFILAHPEFGYHAFIISLTSATGQLFIFFTIAEFGALVFTTIMVTRQMLSILLSCFLYGHDLSTTASLGVAIVFVALFLQIYAKWRLKQSKARQESRSSTASKV